MIPSEAALAKIFSSGQTPRLSLTVSPEDCPEDHPDGLYREITLTCTGEAKQATDALLAWLPKLIPGGWFSGDKYDDGCVRSEVNAFFGERRARIQVREDQWRASLAPLTPHAYPRDFVLGRDLATSRPVLHLNFVPWGGLGDLLMATAAMGTLWERFPEILFDCYGWRYLEVFDGLPFVRKTHGDYPPPGNVNMQTLGDPSDGVRGTIASQHYALNVHDLPAEKRRMRYCLTEQERQAGRAALEAAGWRGQPVIGLQTHGGWQSKRWTRMAEFTRLAQEKGFAVAVFGQKDGFWQSVGGYVGKLPELPSGVIDLCGKLPTVREFAGAQSHLHCWLGFDSGGSYLAAALGIPTVALFATHDPKTLLLSAGAAGPVEAIWPNKAWACQQAYGTNCRTDLHAASWGGTGEFCPLMHGEPGSLCLSEVAAEEVWGKVEAIMREPLVLDTVGPFGLSALDSSAALLSAPLEATQ